MTQADIRPARYIAGAAVALAITQFSVPALSADFDPFATSTLNNYLLVGNILAGKAEGVKASSGIEFGAVFGPDPQGRPFTFPGPPPPVPPEARPIAQGVQSNGRVAITGQPGKINLQDMNVFDTVGVECASSFSVCADNGGFFSNTTFTNSPTGAGQSAIGLGNGLTVNVDFTNLLGDIQGAKNVLQPISNGLTNGTVTPDVVINTNQGKIENKEIVQLNSGVNIVTFERDGLTETNIDVTSGGNLIFDGPDDAFAFVFVPEDAEFMTNEGNLLVSDTMDLENVVIISLLTDPNNAEQTAFNLNDTFINGVALWDLADNNHTIDFDNVYGCTQVVGDKLDFNNVRLTKCGLGDVQVVPVPAAAWLFGTGLAVIGLFGARRRKRSTAAV